MQLEDEPCAKYITEHQFGLVLPPRKATGSEMVKAIKTILETPHFRENAQRLAEPVRNGEVAGAEL